jgi:hypothetical protein
VDISRETFFRPEVIERESVTLRPDVFNRARLALARSVTDCAFIPIRSMQFQAVITHDEIIFVDNQGYAVKDGEGGRIIVLAWDLSAAVQRDSLNQPVPIEIFYFERDLREVHRRIMSEFPIALDSHMARDRSQCRPGGTARIVPLPANR